MKDILKLIGVILLCWTVYFLLTYGITIIHWWSFTKFFDTLADMGNWNPWSRWGYLMLPIFYSIFAFVVWLNEKGGQK